MTTPRKAVKGSATGIATTLTHAAASRRKFLLAAGVLLGVPQARAQQATPVIGFLNGASYALSADLVRAFHQGLSETGFVEGRNVAFDYRSADGQYDRLPALAAELVQRRVNLIAATGTPTGLPAKAATKTIPIPVVFVTGSDPVDQGLVATHGRPGGNLTGATTLAVELGQKRMELLRQLLPKATVFGVLVNQKGPNLAVVSRDLRAAAATVGVPVHFVEASSEPELETAFSTLVGARVGGLVIGTDTFFNSQSRRLAALALQHAVPSIYQYREFVAAGGLMSFAGSITDAYRLAGIYAGRILKGEKPSELPVQRSTKAELFINLATARKLSVTIPHAVLVRADEVFE